MVFWVRERDLVGWVKFEMLMRMRFYFIIGVLVGREDVLMIDLDCGGGDVDFGGKYIKSV